MSVLRSIFYYVISAVTLVTKPTLLFVFRLIYGPKGRTVSKVIDPILLQSASKVARGIRSREVTAEAVMQAYIQRAKEVNPVVNAIVAERYEQALEEAREVDRKLSHHSIPEELSERNKPFLGVPLTVKEAFALQGMPNCSGLMIRKNVKAESDATTVHRLKEAGMIPFACTNTSELCMWYESANNVYGRTKNAYDVTKIVGGSSGGEGCIISAGASLMGVGSDIGGSIRMPAFFNGIFGHKPSKDVVPNEGQHPPATGGQVELLATGPMCRFAEDLLPSLRIMAGPDASKLKLDTETDVKQLRVFSVEDDGGSLFTARVDLELKEAQRKAIKYLASVGSKTETRPLNLMKYSLEMWSAKMAAGEGTRFACFMAGALGGESSPKKVNCFIEMIKWLVGKSDHTLPAIGLGMLETFTPGPESDPNIPKLLNLLQVLHDQLSSLLGENGVLLYPSHPSPAPYHNLPILCPFNFTYTAIFNALGFPVTQVPLGLSREGLPLGLQVVGAPYQDHLTIAVAAKLEEGLGGWVSPGGGGEGRQRQEGEGIKSE